MELQSYSQSEKLEVILQPFSDSFFIHLMSQQQDNPLKHQVHGARHPWLQ
jgi:hypothetical protein